MDDLSRFQQRISLVASALIAVAYMTFLASRPALGAWANCGTLAWIALHAGVLVVTGLLIGLLNLLVHDVFGVLFDRLRRHDTPRYEDVFVDYDEHERVEKPLGRLTKFLVTYPFMIAAIVIAPAWGLLAIDQLAKRVC